MNTTINGVNTIINAHGAMSSFEREVTSALTPEQLSIMAPAALSTTHRNLSDRYNMISTRGIIEALESEGFVVTQATDVQRRRGSDFAREHGKHIIRMTHVDNLGGNSEYRNDMILSTSHDGQASFKATLGVLRFVCSNGMIAFDESPGAAGFSVKFHHANSHITQDSVVAACMRLARRSAELDSLITEMDSIKLADSEIQEFARRAGMLRLRLSEDTDAKVLARYDFSRMVQPKRPEDAGNTLWKTLNIAQEHGIKGGITLLREGTKHAKPIRRLTGTEALLTFNQDIFELAEQYRQRHVTAA